MEIIKLTHIMEACGKDWKMMAMNEIDRTLVIRHERERAVGEVGEMGEI